MDERVGNRVLRTTEVRKGAIVVRSGLVEMFKKRDRLLAVTDRVRGRRDIAVTSNGDISASLTSNDSSSSVILVFIQKIKREVGSTGILGSFQHTYYVTGKTSSQT